MNYKSVFYILGIADLLEAAVLLIPCFVAVIYKESCVKDFLLTILISAVLGILLIGICKKRNPRLSISDGFAIAGLSWISLSLIGALPFFLSGEVPNYIDAFFETVSGFTTTGASILTDLDSISRSLLFWRSFTHWLGGMGFLVFIMAVVNTSTDRSINILRAEMPGHSVFKFAAKEKTIVQILYLIYFILTMIEIILLKVGGMTFYDSILHAMGTAGTGGFAIRADSVASYSHFCQYVIAIFMFIFGISFNVFILFLARQFKAIKAYNEFWLYLGLAFISTILIAINIFPMYRNVADTLRLSTFQVTSLISSTGFQTVVFDTWPSFSKGILILLFFVGGCTGSTAGGFKVYRVSALLQIFRNELIHVANPRKISVVKINGKTLSNEEERGILSYLVIYLITTVIIFLLISREPFGFESCFAAVTSCFNNNNIGVGFGLVSATGSFSNYTDFSKIVLCFTMLMGRLEFFPILALFSRKTWLKAHR